MGAFGKYTAKERKIARRIWEVKGYQRRLYNKWHYWDMIISNLKEKLKGKYDLR